MKITDKLRKLLVARGMDPAATDEQARSFLGVMSEEARNALEAESGRSDDAGGSAGSRSSDSGSVNPPAAESGRAALAAANLPTEDSEAIRAKAIRDERERATAIRGAVRNCGLPEADAQRYINEGVSLDAARAAMIDAMALRSGPLSGRLEMGATDQEKFRAAAVDGMAFGLGVRHADEKAYAPGYDAFRTTGLQMLVRECLEREGVRTALLTPSALAARAMGSATTSDFTSILANVAFKIARKAYVETTSTWRPFCNVNSAKDFKSMDRPQMSGFSDLDLINEDGEYKAGKFSDNKETYALKSYGKQFALSRQTIINDDLGMFTRIPRLFGSAAQRKQSDLVYAIFASNPTMNADGVALFHTNHGNLDGTAAGLTTTSLSRARAAMRKQTDPSGVKLNLSPQFLLVGPDRQTDAEVLLRSISQVQDNRSSGVINPFYESLIPIVEARLDASSGAEAWYTVADPSQIDTIEVSYLDGNDMPFIDEAVEFSVDAVKYKVRIDFGVAPLDHRGFYKNPGDAV